MMLLVDVDRGYTAFTIVCQPFLLHVRVNDVIISGCRPSLY